MASPRVCVLRAPGTNCDVETAFAFDAAGARADRLHLFRLLESPNLLDEYQVLCIAGGFSYGDDVGAGVVFGAQLRSHLGEAVGRFLNADKLVLGICNGFQVLLKSGILPAESTGWPVAETNKRNVTLTWNENGRYTALWVRLAVASANSVFLSGIDEIELPIAHAEGRIAVSDPALVDVWQAAGQIALRYTNGEPATAPEAPLPYPGNPNGSIANIAGLSDPTGRILGLMPHPERYLFATQHPTWTRRPERGEGAGMALFRNAVNYFRAS
ncbi:MAG: phosphoribosylformylglycinamidine synthase subunit PurQ [Planctomycetota bacterium]|nr:MAG: phosphoribosylformylglycinamidine synthase subunit PurQ [Planctomycetota bacterium]